MNILDAQYLCVLRRHLTEGRTSMQKYLEKMKEEQGVTLAKNTELESKLSTSQEEIRR